MRRTIEREVVGAIAEIIPAGSSCWRGRAATLAADRLVPILQAEAFLECAGTRFSIPAELAETWAARLADVYENVEAAIAGAIGVDDDMLGDLIETLDLVSRHVRTTIEDFRREGNRTPEAFVYSTS